MIVEVVSAGKDNWERDYIQKRREYETAGIFEYWIVDPQERKISVLVLDGKQYREHGIFCVGDVATSAFLDGFEVEAQKVFERCENANE